MFPRDVSQHGHSFKSFLFFHNVSVHGPLLDTMAQQPFMPCGCDTKLLYFMYMPSVRIWSGGAAVTEVKPLALLTVPALILMEAHIIAHAIKEVQMLSASAHIVISRCNTSLIVVVFLFFPPLAASHPLWDEAGLIANGKSTARWISATAGRCFLFAIRAETRPPLKPRQRAHRKESNISQDHKVDLSHASNFPENLNVR